ncbi:MAG: hypothetical protein QOE93_1017, partial [Actinomycetota bacterium]|nr:hypothetical protein [Actinomycetota bacterium]
VDGVPIACNLEGGFTATARARFRDLVRRDIDP